METESENNIQNIHTKSSIDLVVQSIDRSSSHPLTFETTVTMNQTKSQDCLTSESPYEKPLKPHFNLTLQPSKIILNDITAKSTPRIKFKFKNCSQDAFCPECNQKGMSRVSKRSGLLTYLLCVGLCCICPFNTYIFCCVKCKDTYHYCNHCSNFLGSNKII